MVRNRKGFTIIEVVLVLAIGGLIFLMVFVALPNLQRNQRNLQRRRAVDEVFAAAEVYRKNNNKLPFNYGNSSDINEPSRFDTNFIIRYVDETCTFKNEEMNSYGDRFYYTNQCSGAFVDPDGTPYSVTVVNGGNQVSLTPSIYSSHGIVVSVGSKCGKDEGTREALNIKNKYMIFMVLEGGSVYCVDNS